MRGRQEELRFTDKTKEEEENCYVRPSDQRDGGKGFACKDVDAGNPDKRISSTTRKNVATGRPDRSTRGHGLNGAGSEEDGGQQDRKCY